MDFATISRLVPLHAWLHCIGFAKGTFPADAGVAVLHTTQVLSVSVILVLQEPPWICRGRGEVMSVLLQFD